LLFMLFGFTFFSVSVYLRGKRKLVLTEIEKVSILEEREAMHQLLSDRIDVMRESERTRIARELHDELGQALTILKFDVKWLESKVKDQEHLLLRCHEMEQNVSSTIKNVQRISSELRPSILDKLGLAAALEWHAQEYERKSGLHIQLLNVRENIPLDQKASISLFRIFQEALVNISRHAHATEVIVNFYRTNGSAILEIKDNGVGISRTAVNELTSLGLIGMVERARLIGAEVNFEGQPGVGTTVRVRVPLA